MRLATKECRGTVVIGSFALTISVYIALLIAYPKASILVWIGLTGLGVFIMAYLLLPRFLFGQGEAFSTSPPLHQYWRKVLLLIPMIVIIGASILYLIYYKPLRMPEGMTRHEAEGWGLFAFPAYVLSNIAAFFGRLDAYLHSLWVPFAVLAICITLPMMMIYSVKAFRRYAVLPVSTKKTLHPGWRGIGVLLVFSTLNMLIFSQLSKLSQHGVAEAIKHDVRIIVKDNQVCFTVPEDELRGFMWRTKPIRIVDVDVIAEEKPKNKDTRVMWTSYFSTMLGNTDCIKYGDKPPVHAEKNEATVPLIPGAGYIVSLKSVNDRTANYVTHESSFCIFVDSAGTLTVHQLMWIDELGRNECVNNNNGNPIVIAYSDQDKLDAAITAYNKEKYKIAFDLFQKLANTGNAVAQYKLGFMYDKGHGVEQNDTRAVVWYRKAAEQGDADAQSKLGVMYYLGQGVNKDYVHAHMWWTLSAAQGKDSAKKNLAILAKIITAKQREEAERLAREWKPIALLD